MDIFSYKLGQKRGGGSGGGGGGSVRLQNKTFNANGTYKADAGYDGLGTVTVDVAGSGGSDEDWIIGDGNTHLWITLPEGRTSPMLGVCPNGTVTVDWGDGSAPDVLTGTSTSTVKWTPNHQYTAAGDYIITLTVDGEMGFSGVDASYAYAYILRYSPEQDGRNAVYQNALKKIEIGNGVKSIGSCALQFCFSLTSVAIPDGVTQIEHRAFQRCYSLTSIAIPDGVTKIGPYAFQTCVSLTDITIPNSVKSIDYYALAGCYALQNVIIPNSVTSMGSSLFSGDSSLTSINIPEGITRIDSSMFSSCSSLTNIIIPNSVNNIISSAFYYCTSMKFYDFTNHTAVPTLSATNAFQNIPADCEIRVPAALADEWKAATNWSTYADYIVGV